MLDYFKALSDINRLRIFNLLVEGQLCVCEIEVILNISQSNLSKHLSTLKKSRIIVSQKQSLWTIYSINEQFIKENELLYTYIKDSILNNDVLIKDSLRLKKYHDKNISCQLSSENKQEVLNILEKED